ncbi:MULTISPECIES: hypothetical protein [Legionella]|uniref:Uncharacterized protein n=1 Tax=Legionella septentrionalis TaxID=2498109 RepID=A0A433JK76_9GAMM|nr:MULTISPECIES: hypothetical protein [Legionella]MCP0914351.1 hypothetical protein [Legionella sp. 27cVA30]RUQ88989.1 hypothetical protein EKM59_04115 [Legionella septentrionalis]RUR00296.1 hypothetical protein ELY11_02820 [Legionella septentrionalis]RUR11847.1 hypothetical protein ELY14_00975 [Legionella septentrionalis]RUR17534.1 hypothetical protein ELY10_00970 [Legionella septentrionalis]
MFTPEIVSVKDIPFNYLVADQQGKLLQVGHNAHDDPAAALLPSTTVEPNEAGFTHAYVVYPCRFKEILDAQIIFLKAFTKQGSSHGGFGLIFNLARKKPSWSHNFVNLEFSPQEENQIFSGECRSALTLSGVKQMLGHDLTNIDFNLRGSRTDMYRESSEELLSYIPASLIIGDETYDVNIVYHADTPHSEGPGRAGARNPVDLRKDWENFWKKQAKKNVSKEILHPEILTQKNKNIFFKPVAAPDPASMRSTDIPEIDVEASAPQEILASNCRNKDNLTL